MYYVQLADEAKKSLRKIPKQWQGRMKQALLALRIQPHAGKKLHGKFEGHYVVRVWPYRILYKVYNQELLVFVIDLGHRQGIYR